MDLLEVCDFGEFYSGMMAYTCAGHLLGMIGVPYDIDYHKDMDMTAVTGLVLAFIIMLRIKPGGSCIFAPKCSSWLWVSRGTSYRSEGFPMGRMPDIEFVEAANIMVSRTVLLMWIGIAKTLFMVTENPRGSLLEMHRRFQEFLRAHSMYRSSQYLCNHGAESDKA